MYSNVDSALEYVLFITRHVRRGDPSAAIMAILIELGFQSNSDGFEYLRESVLLKTHNHRMRLSSIYNEVINLYDSAVGYNQIDQAIRSSVKSAWYNGDLEKWGYFFPECQSGAAKKPSNSRLISQFACFLDLLIGVSEEVTYEAE